MKIKRMLLAFLTITLMATTIISFVSAATIPVPMTIGYKDQNTLIWNVHIKHKNSLYFDGGDVILSSLKFWYAPEESPKWPDDYIEITTVEPINIVASKTKLLIYWNFQALKDEGISGNFGSIISGDLVSGDDFYGIGPGWTGAFRPK